MMVLEWLTYINLLKYSKYEGEDVAAWKLITVKPNLYSRLEGQIRCTRCGELFFVGSKAWAHLCPRKGSSYTEYYCLMCYTVLWIK